MTVNSLVSEEMGNYMGSKMKKQILIGENLNNVILQWPGTTYIDVPAVLYASCCGQIWQVASQKGVSS